MEDYKLDKIEQFKELNLLDENNNIQLSEANIQKLKQGGITDELFLENIQIDNQVLNFKAKLSIYEDQNGEARLTVHPMFNEHQNSAQLSNEENNYFRDNNIHSKDVICVGTITDFGEAAYKNNPKNSASYYITLEKRNGELCTIWGKELRGALSKSGKNIGDKIVLENKGTENVVVKTTKRDDKGNEIGYEYKRTNKNLFDIHDYKENEHQAIKDKNILFQYDKESKSFKSVNTDKIDLITQINNQIVNEEQKEKIKKGERILIDDETNIQLSPIKGKALISNKALLITSMLLDGGLSFLIIKTAEKINQSQKEKKDSYSKGYTEALNKLKGELLQKQAKYPDNIQIQKDLSIVSNEISKVSVAGNTVGMQKENESNDVKLNVNDPDTYQDALRDKENKIAELKVGDKILYEKENVEIISIRQDDDNNKIKFYGRGENGKEYALPDYMMKELYASGKIEIPEQKVEQSASIGRKM